MDEQVLKMLLNISSFVGTFLGLAGLIVGIISLVITIKTFKKTKIINDKVEKAIEMERTKRAYPSKHKAFMDAILKALDSYNEGSRSRLVITDLLSTGETVKAFYIGWKSDSKKELDDFLNFLNSLPKNSGLDNRSRDELCKKLCAIKATLEKEKALQ